MTLSDLLGRVIDTGSEVLVARNTPAAPAPTDAPRVVPPPSALPPATAATAAGTSPLYPLPPVVWVLMAAAVAGGMIYAARRR